MTAGALYFGPGLCYHRCMKNLRNWVMDLAYIRSGNIIYTDEAVILACLLHSKGKGRDTKDFKDLQRIMKDKNLEPEDAKHLNRKKD